MRAVLQRVSEASVTIEGQLKSSIQKGLLILIGFEENDSQEELKWLSLKIVNMRIFGDENELMNLSVKDIKGQLLIISQFTLHAQTKKGNRPSFIKAAKPITAIPLYEQFISQMIADSQLDVQTGEFGADMKVRLLNDGPVTITIDTRNRE